MPKNDYFPYHKKKNKRFFLYYKKQIKDQLMVTRWILLQYATDF